MENYEISQPHQGDQGQAGVPQVPLLGHVGEIETLDWACGLDSDPKFGM